MSLTQEQLKEYLNYYPDTGTFTWKEQGTKKATVGYISKDKGNCRIIRVHNKDYKAHQLAVLWMLGKLPTSVDHLNKIKYDDRWENLAIRGLKP